MKKSIMLFASIVLFSISVFSYSQDILLPDSIFSFETMPFFISSENRIPVYWFESSNSYNEKMFLQSDNIIDGMYVSKNISSGFKNSFSGESFYRIDADESLFYDISLISDAYSNRIYGSLFKNDSVFNFKSLSRFVLANQVVSDYSSMISAEYGRVSMLCEVQKLKKYVYAGYKFSCLHLFLGLNNKKEILVKGSVNIYNIFVLSSASYNYISKSAETYLSARYLLRIGMLNIAPIIVYDTTLTAGAGALYRLTSEFSVYAGGGVKKENVFCESGVKFKSKMIFMDFSPVCYDDSTYKLRLSANMHSRLLKLNVNAEYGDTLLYSIQSALSYPVFSGNLIPSLFVSYDGRDEAEGILSAKLVDAEIYFGCRFFIESNEYLLKGGIAWQFKN